jgi:hypothetical protein
MQKAAFSSQLCLYGCGKFETRTRILEFCQQPSLTSVGTDASFVPPYFGDVTHSGETHTLRR